MFKTNNNDKREIQLRVLRSIKHKIKYIASLGRERKYKKRKKSDHLDKNGLKINNKKTDIYFIIIHVWKGIK